MRLVVDLIDSDTLDEGVTINGFEECDRAPPF